MSTHFAAVLRRCEKSNVQVGCIYSNKWKEKIYKWVQQNMKYIIRLLRAINSWERVPMMIIKNVFLFFALSLWKERGDIHSNKMVHALAMTMTCVRVGIFLSFNAYPNSHTERVPLVTVKQKICVFFYWYLIIKKIHTIYLHKFSRHYLYHWFSLLALLFFR